MENENNRNIQEAAAPEIHSCEEPPKLSSRGGAVGGAPLLPKHVLPGDSDRKGPIRGWLLFFLIVYVGLGSFMSVIGSFFSLNIADYELGFGRGMAIVGISADIIMFVGIAVMAIYMIWSFFRFKPNAVSLARGYIIIIMVSNLIGLLGASESGNMAKAIAEGLRGLLLGALWLYFFKASEQVKVSFPREERQVYKRDLALMIGTIGPGILWLIVVFVWSMVFYAQNPDMLYIE